MNLTQMNTDYLFETVFSWMPGLTILTDSNLNILTASKSFQKTFQTNLKELCGQNLLKLVHIEEIEAEQIREYLESGKNSNRVMKFETFLAAGDDKGLWAIVETRFFKYQGETVGISVFTDITTEKIEERKLKAENNQMKAWLGNVPRLETPEETYSLLVNNLPLPTYIVQDQIIRFVNPAFQALTEYSQEEIIGRNATELIHPEDISQIQENVKAIINSGKPSKEEFRLICKNGETRRAIGTISTIPYNGRIAILGTIMDLTESKFVESAIQEARDRYQTIFNSASDTIFINDFTGKLLEVNDAASQSIGYSKSELLNMSLKDIDSPKYAALIPQNMRQVMEKGSHTFESEQLARDGHMVPVEIHARIIEYKKSKAMLSVIRDITERKQIETIRLRNEARLESLVKISQIKPGQIHDLLYLALEEIVRLTGSREGYIYNYHPQQDGFSLDYWSKELIKEHTLQNLPPGSLIQSQGLLKEVIQKRQPVIADTPQVSDMLQNGYPEIQTKLNKSLYIPVMRNKEIAAIVSVSNKESNYDQMDIQQINLLMDSVWSTLERWKAEEALRESEEYLKNIFNSILAGIVVIDVESHTIVDVNDLAAKMIGEGKSQILGKTCHNHICPAEIGKCPITDLHQTVDRSERKLIRADHKTTDILKNVVPIVRNGRPQLLEFFIDITKRKQAEEETRDSERRFRELAELLPVLIFEADLKGQVTFINDIAARMFEVKREELIGLNIFEFIAPEDRERCVSNVRSILTGETIKGNEYTAIKRSGQRFPVLTYSAGIKDGKGNIIGLRGTLLDITERKKIEQDLQENEQKYRLLVENQSDLVVEINPQGEFLFTNPAYCKLSGKNNDQLIGTKVMTQVYPDDREEVAKMLESITQPPHTGYSEHRMIVERGWRWLAWNHNAVLDNQGNIASINCSGRDITESKRAKEELEKANKQLKEIDKLKDNFLSTVSHELRTPLTSIKSFAEILLTYDEDKETQKEFLGIINDESDRLTRLINDFLDLSKIQAGKMQWKTENLSVADVINSAVTSIRPLIDKAQLELLIDIRPDLPHVKCDRDRLIQVVTNLLSNASKFTPEKGKLNIRAWSDQEKDRESHQWVTVSITDTGIGIAPENQRKIFENFGQVGDVLTDRPKGTGLGLPICKKIVENYGGKIWVESTLGKGTTFFFTLPMTQSMVKEQVSPAPTPIVSSAAILPSSHQGKTILVVDDEANIRRFIRHELTNRGHQVIEASGGKEAVDLARKHHPDLITLDICMPDLNGLDVTVVLKNDPDTQNIPILIISVMEDQQKAFRLGANDYIAKPISLEVLLQKVNLLLGGSQKSILVAEEDEVLTHSLEYELRRRGFTVHTAGDRKQTIAALDQNHPDLILLDLKIPGMDGDEIIKAIKNRSDTTNVPIIILTGLEINGKGTTDLKVDSVDYLSKAEGFNQLFEAIDRIASGKTKKDQEI